MDSARFPDLAAAPAQPADPDRPFGPDGATEPARRGVPSLPRGPRVHVGPGATGAGLGADGIGPDEIDPLSAMDALGAIRLRGTVGPAETTGGGPGVPRRKAPVPVKVIVAGGFGVGKTTTVASISEIEPLTTEAEMTSVSAGIDDPGPTNKTTTTVAMDFGCVTIDDSLKLYLFGAPGQVRFGFMWDDLIRGALGALVVVDSARLDDCFAAVDYFERASLPFVVGVNTFYGQLAHDLDTVRWALALDDGIPVVAFDARDRGSVRDAVLVVLNRALDRAVRSQASKT